MDLPAVTQDISVCYSLVHSFPWQPEAKGMSECHMQSGVRWGKGNGVSLRFIRAR